ncbi:hypothetical protein IWW57_001385 [Coemansia sp. S610]|nr:hypothetical protein IWW57_001385 [Coemansia sp. S610]
MDSYDDTPTIVCIESFEKVNFESNIFLIIGLIDVERIKQIHERSIMKRLSVEYFYADLRWYDFDNDYLLSYDEDFEFWYLYCVNDKPAKCPKHILDIIRDACKPVEDPSFLKSMCSIA